MGLGGKSTGVPKIRCFWAVLFPDFRVNGFSRIGRALQEGFWARASLRKVHPAQEVLEVRVGTERVENRIAF